MGFALSGFLSFSFPEDFYRVSSRENYHGFFPQLLSNFNPRRFLSCLFERELSQIFPVVALHFHSPEDFYHVSSNRTFTDITLSGFPSTLNP
jgi:hypothetical protein